MQALIFAVFMYGTAALWHPVRGPPAPELEHPQPQFQRIEDPLARRDAPHIAPRYQSIDDTLYRNQVRHRQPNRFREEVPGVN